MSYKIEDVSSCTKKMIFNFSEVDLTSEIKQELLKKQKESSLKGFRQGKAPLSMIEKLFRAEIENEAYRRFISNKFYDAVMKENLRTVGYPMFNNTKFSKEEGVSFEVMIEIFPEFELADISGLKFNKPVVMVTDEDVQNLKTQYASSKAELVELKDETTTLTKGHFAVFNFKGTKSNGESPAEMKGDEFLLEIGSKRFIPGFEDGMEGMKKGEQKDIELTFPEDYHEESLKNEKVTFHVELLEIKEKKLPEFSDEFVKEIGYEGVADFEEKTLKNLKRQKETEAKQKLNQEIIEKLVDLHKFDIPNTMLMMQEEAVMKDLEKTLKQQGFNDAMMKDYFVRWKEDIGKKAEFQVKSGLILDKMSEKFAIETVDADLEAKYAQMAEATGMKIEDIKSYYSKSKDVERNLRYAIREEKTFEKILETCAD
jgi:trigger factor